jgi:hypothetical protein
MSLRAKEVCHAQNAGSVEQIVVVLKQAEYVCTPPVVTLTRFLLDAQSVSTMRLRLSRAYSEFATNP